MNLNELKLAMATALRNAGIEPLSLPAEMRPSAWLEGRDLEIFVAQVATEFQGGIWTEGPLPNGYPAPAEAVPGAAYWIATPNGSLIFQYGSSPYAPETPGLAPGALTPDNAVVAFQRHLQAEVEAEAKRRLVEEYVSWVAGQML